MSSALVTSLTMMRGRKRRIVATNRFPSSGSIDSTSRSRSKGVRIPRWLRWSMASRIRSRTSCFFIATCMRL